MIDKEKLIKDLIMGSLMYGPYSYIQEENHIVIKIDNIADAVIAGEWVSEMREQVMIASASAAADVAKKFYGITHEEIALHIYEAICKEFDIPFEK